MLGDIPVGCKQAGHGPGRPNDKTSPLRKRRRQPAGGSLSVSTMQTSEPLRQNDWFATNAITRPPFGAVSP